MSGYILRFIYNYKRVEIQNKEYKLLIIGCKAKKQKTKNEKNYNEVFLGYYVSDVYLQQFECTKSDE